MTATDVTQTRDTSGVVGNSGPAPTGTASTATIKDTTPTGGAGGGDNNKPATQPDTSAAQGGAPYVPKDHAADNAITQTLVTNVGGGNPRPDVDPAYRAPAQFPGASTYDTTRTDTPISDGSTPSMVNLYQTGNRDTVNPTVTLQTTTANLPATPGTPSVAAGSRCAYVTITEVAEPTGAPIRGYRVEGSTGGVTFVPKNPIGSTTVGTVQNLVPSQSYTFRVAAVNDNGDSAFSAASAAVVPLNPDEPGAGQATSYPQGAGSNPIYLPNGTMKPGTGGTPGAVQSLAVVAGAGAAGTANVTFTQSLYGTPTSYDVFAYSDAARTVLVGSVYNTTDLVTGVTVAISGFTAAATAYVKVVGKNALGNGVPAYASGATHA